MNKEQLIALGLTEEQAQSVVDGFGQMVPKTRLDDKIKELKDAQAAIADRDTQLEDLKPKAAGNEALLQQIQKLQDENKTATEKYQQDLAETQRTFALDSALKDAKVHNVKAVKALLDNDKIKLNGEALEGLEEQLAALKESDAYLFATEKADTPPLPQFAGGNPTPPGGNQMTRDEFAKLSYEKRVDFQQSNPTAFTELFNNQ